MSEIPTTMKRLVVTAPGKDLASCTIEIEEVPVPKPARGEVLIKVVAAVINPSDYGAWFRCKPEHCPVTMGKEGSGVVVASGGGLSSMAIRTGSSVGFVNLPYRQGTYSEYVVATAMGSVFSMPQDLPTEDVAAFFVNPYTAIGIIDTAKSQGAKAFVHTAAASQLGQMIVKLAPSEGVEVINVVRREEQAELLKNIGAKHVIVSIGDSWKEELAAKIKELGATVAFDAVAGQSTGDMMDALPKKGTVYVYGRLAGKIQGIDPLDMIYHGKKLKSFFLSNWISQGGVLATVIRLKMAGGKVNDGLGKGGWSSTSFQDTKMENVQTDCLLLRENGATGKKLRIRFD